ncbi:GtrA family protein [Bacillus zhangzhouensis]|uniref:Membrane protein n=1 Tax=Bacillus zhangzhouensis TaxID=1178540 RepID=A0A081L9J6_9BACI|nr:GtrA family protein [Bacillus zhangzhouensis]KEP25922.1 membrane protein [Bacillus zhangzhouensis]
MTRKRIRTYAAFSIVGASNTLIDFMIFFLLTACFVPYFLAQCLSYSAGMMNSYFWNRKWTFQVKKKADKWEWIKWMTVNGAACLLTYLVLYVMQQLGCTLLLSKVIATFAGFMITFTGSRVWVFQSVNKKAEMER